MERLPGPDGFFMSFYLTLRDSKKEDIKSVIHMLYASRQRDVLLQHCGNPPKISHASELKDFRPINLITGCI